MKFNITKDVLKQVAKVMNKDGLLVIQTGNAASGWAKLMGKNWHFFAQVVGLR